MTREEIEQALSPALVSAPTVADILTISKAQVYELIHAGRLEAINTGSSDKPYFRVRSKSVRKILGLDNPVKV